MSSLQRQIVSASVLAFVLGLCLDLTIGHGGHQSGFRSSQVHESDDRHHHCDHGHHHHRHEEKLVFGSKLPEELAEEEDMKLYGFGSYQDHDHDHDHGHFAALELSGFGLWFHAMGCSFLVSMASLICLIILPVIFVQGKPSKAVVDSLALFGAGAMLGDAFLHQLPHAFGGEHSHSQSHHGDHDHDAGLGHKHSHSLKDLSIGISVLAGIVLFLLVEKLVRYVEENSQGRTWTHGHHHHHKSSKNLKDDNFSHVHEQSESFNANDNGLLNEGREANEASDDSLKGDDMNDLTQHGSIIRKRTSSSAVKDDNGDEHAVDGSTNNIESLNDKEYVQSPTNLVFGYLNLFSDGVHNFTDGMALGSAFLLYGSVGGWSRTLFLLAHELPQEVGDFGILVRSGFSIFEALFFNFLSALVALAGTALALLWGQDPGQSSLIEGFTAGGFIYIAVAGVLAEMNNNGNSTLKCTAIQLSSLILGMSVALCISLVE
ncbi:IAA-alanine resistance protein 1 [Quillaja saponaria]|uniref:IAA-alanine resistance protein 1 n=1 Tax=Quillaja saponaria TaxID=32244 RepID=A0AAD7PG92_QUISA|nr:IAA-alanine resistance protein 1 [Quillaja saponaria]